MLLNQSLPLGRWLAVAGLMALTSLTQAAEPALVGTNLNLIPADQRLWTEGMLWDRELRVESGLGYKDNVLLSPYHRQGSAFFIYGLDALLLRLPLDGWEVVGSVTGDDTRYWRNVGTGSEASFIGTLRAQREFAGGWKATLEWQGLYEKEVLDISANPGTPATALVAGESLKLNPSLRKDAACGGWLQVAMPVSRWWLAAPLDDWWEFGPVVTAGFAAGPRTEFTARYGATYENHNSWTALEYADGSVPLPRKLAIFQDRAEVAWRQYWDPARRWQTASELALVDKIDNGGGYFNEYQYQVRENARWQTTNWLARVNGAMTYEDYRVQWIGRLNGETLNRNLIDLGAEVERHLWRGLRVYAKGNYQRGLSNADLGASNYHATTVIGGVRWDF